MATSYSDVRTLVRAAIGDFGIRDSAGNVVSNSQDYHDDDVDDVITLTLLKFSDYSGDGSDITPTFANDSDKGAVALLVGLNLILPAGTFSMETPNMRYWVQSNKELIAFLWGQIEQFLGAQDIRPEIWGALDQLYNEGVLVADRIAGAVAAI